MQAHLNDRQFADALLRCAAPSVAAHLEECPECALEIETLRSQCNTLRDAAVTWSETRPMPSLAAKATEQARGGWLRGMAVAAAMLVMLPAGYLLLQPGDGAPQQQTQAPVTKSVAQHAQIAEDNALLRAVNQELAEQVAPAMQPMLSVTATSTNAETVQ